MFSTVNTFIEADRLKQVCSCKFFFFCFFFTRCCEDTSPQWPLQRWDFPVIWTLGGENGESASKWRTVTVNSLCMSNIISYLSTFSTEALNGHVSKKWLTPFFFQNQFFFIVLENHKKFMSLSRTNNLLYIIYSVHAIMSMLI